MGERKKTETAPAPWRSTKQALFDLADIAIDAARRAGADYVDIRLGETRREFLRAREDRLEDVGESADAGFGLRVLRDGCWGFYGATTFSRAAILTGVETRARQCARGQANPAARNCRGSASRRRGALGDAARDRSFRGLRRRQGRFSAVRERRRPRRRGRFLSLDISGGARGAAFRQRQWRAHRADAHARGAAIHDHRRRQGVRAASRRATASRRRAAPVGITPRVAAWSRRRAGAPRRPGESCARNPSAPACAMW